MLPPDLSAEEIQNLPDVWYCKDKWDWLNERYCIASAPFANISCSPYTIPWPKYLRPWKIKLCSRRTLCWMDAIIFWAPCKRKWCQCSITGVSGFLQWPRNYGSSYIIRQNSLEVHRERWSFTNTTYEGGRQQDSHCIVGKEDMGEPVGLQLR